VVHTGEYVTLVREPHNPYDRNAVRVDNMAGVQVGHISRTLAAALAALMDDRSRLAPRVEASIPRPSTNIFQTPLELFVYGLPEAAGPVAAVLRRYGARFQTKSGPGAASPASASVVASRTVRAATNSQAEVDALLDTLANSAEKLPPFDAAAGAPALLARLHDFQAAGVAWMLRREVDPDGAVSGGGLPPFWSKVREQGADAYLNAITNSSQAEPPAPVTGGLLADDMGLGKSIQVIALILANVRPRLC
jgi:SWI/SNF-related matrix-associated actin-dependent regulator of chromatin subfamily A3